MSGTSNNSKAVYELDTYAIHYIALCLWVRGALRDLSRNTEEARNYQMSTQQFAIETTLGMFVQMMTSIIRQGVNEDDWYDVLEIVHNAIDEEMNLGEGDTSGSQDLTDLLNSMRSGISVPGGKSGSKSGKGGPGDDEIH